MIMRFAIAIAAISISAGVAVAGMGPPPGPVATMVGDEDTSLFAGINWNFGSGGSNLDGSVGVIYSEADASGDVTGALVSLNFDLQGRGNPADLRFAGFAGSDDVAGQIGFGFNLDGSGAFGLAGFIANYVQGGVSLGFNGDFGGFAGFHTYEFVEPRVILGVG